MSFHSFFSLLPSRRTLVTVVLSTVAGASLAITASAWLARPHEPGPGPSPPRNARFIAIGKAYLPVLGRAYAAAWEDGAKQLESGGGISAALDTVAKSWSSKRTQIYDQVLTPEFSKIVTESVKDADVTPRERADMAAAWRGLALGLAK